jgi:hypothetical protein
MSRWNHKISLPSGTKLPQTRRFNQLWKRYYMLANLSRPNRDIGQSAYQLSDAAGSFANAIEKDPTLAQQFWPEPLESLLPKLREFSKRLYDDWFALWSSLESIPAPSPRGPGDRLERAYGNAIAHTLENIGGLSRERQNIVIAVLTNVVFFHHEGNEIPAETIKVRRRRRRRTTPSRGGGQFRPLKPPIVP